MASFVVSWSASGWAVSAGSASGPRASTAISRTVVRRRSRIRDRLALITIRHSHASKRSAPRNLGSWRHASRHSLLHDIPRVGFVVQDRVGQPEQAIEPGPDELLEGEPIARLRPRDEGDGGVGRRASDRDRRDAHRITHR